MQRKFPVAGLFVLIETLGFRNPGVNERTQVEVSAGIREMQAGRRHKREITVFQGEWGFSFAYNAPVSGLLTVRARNTLLLTASATFLAWLIAVPSTGTRTTGSDTTD